MTLFRNALLAGLLAIVPGCLDLPKWHDAPRDAGTSQEYDAHKKEDAYKPTDTYHLPDVLQDVGIDTTPSAQDAGNPPKYDAEKKEDAYQVLDVERQPDAVLDTRQEEHDARTLEDVVNDSHISLPDSEGDVYDGGPLDTGTPDVIVVPECVITGNLEPFYTGPIETAGRGECKIGERLCIDNNGRPTYVTVTPEVTPLPESCNNKDDDCEGNIDNGYDVGVACDNGLLGACLAQGTNECTLDGLETRCNARVIEPQPEVCNQQDDDCNGEFDERDICISQWLIAYYCRQRDDICLIRLDGSNERNLTANVPSSIGNGIFSNGGPTQVLPVSWSGDGQWIAFLEDNEGIYRVNVETGQVRFVIAGNLWAAAYSPDNTKIAYTGGIWSLENGGLQASIGRVPVWFRDGRSVISEERGEGFYKYDLQGDEHELIVGTSQGMMFAISPDQTKSLFTYRGIGGTDVGLVQFGSQENIADVSDISSDFMPVFVDNDRYVFVSDRTGDYDMYLKQIGIDGVVNLTNNPARDEMPAVSPDGAYVVFVSDRDGTKDLYKVEVATGIQTRLTDDPGDEEAPVFAPMAR